MSVEVLDSLLPTTEQVRRKLNEVIEVVNRLDADSQDISLGLARLSEADEAQVNFNSLVDTAIEVLWEVADPFGTLAAVQEYCPEDECCGGECTVTDISDSDNAALAGVLTDLDPDEVVVLRTERPDGEDPQEFVAMPFELFTNLSAAAQAATEAVSPC